MTQPTLSQQGVQTTTAHQLMRMCPSSEMKELLSQIDPMASTDCNVLIYGETGAGKEVVARTIHERSPRASQPFVPINCGAIPKELAESLLMGHEAGAFTGATRRHIGIFEQASGGTVLLDEIGDLDLHLQVKLLRILDTKVVSRVGSESEIKTDFRLVVATHRSMETMVQEGTFRSDLYYRLNVLNLTVPPLSKRKEDVLVLAAYFLRQIAPDRTLHFTDEAREALENFQWPGNVRQLHTVMERAAIFSGTSSLIDVKHLSDARPENAKKEQRAILDDPRSITEYCAQLINSPVRYKERVEALKLLLFQTALWMTDGNVSRAAKLLGVDRVYFYRRTKGKLSLQDRNSE